MCTSPQVFTRVLTAISTSPPWGRRWRHTLLCPIAEVEYALKILPVEQAASGRGARLLLVVGLRLLGVLAPHQASIDPSSRSAPAIPSKAVYRTRAQEGIVASMA